MLQYNPVARFTHGQLSESAANTRRFNGRKGGRKTILTRDLAKRICEAIATSPHSLQRTIDLHAEHNGANDWPKHHTTIEEWRNKYPWFAALFTRARTMQAEFIAQTCLDFNPTEKDVRTRQGDSSRNLIRVNFEFQSRAAKFCSCWHGDA